MGKFSLRPAKRSSAKPLVGLYAESGCGKTKSALLLARGFVGPQGRIAMIETEAGRGEVFADELPGGYDVISLREEFSPRTYGEAIAAAEKGGAGALIIDSASSEWEGIGGVLDMAAKNQENGKKGPLVWQRPKIDHQKHFMGRLMQTPIDLVIVCMRAKYPMEERFNPRKGKKEWVRSETLAPKQSEDILYEMMVHGWIDREHRFQGTKYTREDLREVIPTGQPISIATGEAFAKWAAGSSGAGLNNNPAGDQAPGVLARIAAAQSLPDLKAIAGELARGEFDKETIKHARAAYRQRQKELGHE